MVLGWPLLGQRWHYSAQIPTLVPSILDIGHTFRENVGTWDLHTISTKSKWISTSGWGIGFSGNILGFQYDPHCNCSMITQRTCKYLEIVEQECVDSHLVNPIIVVVPGISTRGNNYQLDLCGNNEHNILCARILRGFIFLSGKINPYGSHCFAMFAY